ncbi:uncharacterized protein LOC133778914 [Humulus lupulus]|uniref:uncharacterized protein LOC133778914 n=1 Tax=Humulus lupulus TaxID=3486 RepID=UPI002B414272|nr:uncharacterized protein LOC133778914 [Humulus lupulus]
MKLRGGSMLGKKLILKSDHFPGCQNKRLSLQIDGAPNYRHAESLHVHGVAIPTMDGIQNVLNHIHGKEAQVLWMNLREEPVVYINRPPFVLRDVERPFSNLEYTVYKELQVERYLVDYERVPITNEKSPKELDFDILVHKISQADINTNIIFNCQMGRGRTTTGMISVVEEEISKIPDHSAIVLPNNLFHHVCIPRSNSIGRVSDVVAIASENFPNTEEALRRGEYGVIRSLVRVLKGGLEGKRQVDKVIDKCASMQNLREAIATYRNSILRQPDEMKREALLSFFVNFADWKRARPELYSILRRLLRRDPMGALGYASLKPSLMNIVESTDGRPSEMGIVAASRNGEVLGSQTVLKSDHCPGCQNQNLPERVEGAPNFREVPGFPVYGVANPTIDGIRSVIQRIGGSKSGHPVLWHNMREEPVIYINGKPFVLREVERPYKHMLEYSGIDRERVERMEARLKEDILREAEHYGGTIMVIHETNDGQIFDAWEHVNFDAIQTPLEVFKCLEADGFPIKYARVPITDGKAPKSSDFDMLAMNIASSSKDTAFVFNCQVDIFHSSYAVDVVVGGVDTSATETKGTVLIHSADQLFLAGQFWACNSILSHDIENYVKTEEAKVKELIKAIADFGAKVIVSGAAVGEMALHLCERYKLMVLKISSKFELRQFCRTTGAVAMVSHLAFNSTQFF